MLQALDETLASSVHGWKHPWLAILVTIGSLSEVYFLWEWVCLILRCQCEYRVRWDKMCLVEPGGTRCCLRTHNLKMCEKQGYKKSYSMLLRYTNCGIL